MGGSFPVESLAAFVWNRWQISSGIRTLRQWLPEDREYLFQVRCEDGLYYLTEMSSGDVYMIHELHG